MEHYGIWPTTVWEINDSDPLTIRLKNEIRDLGQGRAKAKTGINYKGTWTNKPHTTISIFPPQVVCHVLNMYAIPTGVKRIFDPFTGGGTRAVITAMAGLKYTGIEIRQEEINGIQEVVDGMGVKSRVDIRRGDARDTKLRANSHDMLFTCPPYWNLERYQGGPNDLSMCKTYDQFLDQIQKVVAESKRVLKPGSYAIWVLGLHRHKGELLPLHHDITAIHYDAGFRLHEEVILYITNKQALSRAGTFEKGDRCLIRQHQYLMVYQSPEN